MGSLKAEFVQSGAEGSSRQLGDLCCNSFGEPLVGIDAGPHSCATDAETHHPCQRCLQAVDVVLQHVDITRDFLAQGQWRRILQMRAPNLDQVFPLIGFALQGFPELRKAWKQRFTDSQDGCDVHCRREAVIGRLAHVDVVVGMHRLLAAQCSPADLTTAVRDHLIHIHVELRAAAGHPHEEREFLVMSPLQ